MLNDLTSSDWIAIFSLVVAAISLVVAAISFLVARKTLVDAEEFWKQQKWFDLYELASSASDELDHYQVNYHDANPESQEQLRDLNSLMATFRRVGTLAMVFPKCPVVDGLYDAVSKEVEGPADFLDPKYLAGLNDAVESLRQMALVDPSILNRHKLEKRWYSWFW